MEKYYIKETCKKIGINTYDLRYLEKALNIKAKRDNFQNRFYTENDIITLKSIINLKKQGLNYKAIKTALKIKSNENNNIEKQQYKKTTKELTLHKENNKLTIIKNIINESLNNNLDPKLKEIESKIDNLSENLKSENSILKKEIEKQQEKHFKELDKKLTTWRNTNKTKQKKPWYKKIFLK